ncbi:hypothetical protein BDV93DRAFT_516585 [Ceratobasidium sp. AG-I]|nr:hypothetical protein BDV93DRAFT_516585 [Ceratobasidium sp. AG-I]
MPSAWERQPGVTALLLSGGLGAESGGGEGHKGGSGTTPFFLDLVGFSGLSTNHIWQLPNLAGLSGHKSLDPYPEAWHTISQESPLTPKSSPTPLNYTRPVHPITRGPYMVKHQKIEKLRTTLKVTKWWRNSHFSRPDMSPFTFGSLFGFVLHQFASKQGAK